MTWHDMTWHDMTWHDMTWHDMTWHDMTWHDMTWHDMTWHTLWWHYITLHYITLHYITLLYIALHCIALLCFAMLCILLHCIVLHRIALHYIALQCITFHCIALHWIALHCIALHWIALHCSFSRANVIFYFFYIFSCLFLSGEDFIPGDSCVKSQWNHSTSFCHCTNHSTILQSPSFTPSVFVVFVMRLDMYHFLTSHHSVPSGPKLFSQTGTSKPNITNEMMGPSANGTKTSHCACLQLIHGINTTAATGHPIHARFQIPVIPPRTHTYPVRRRHREVVWINVRHNQCAFVFTWSLDRVVCCSSGVLGIEGSLCAGHERERT